MIEGVGAKIRPEYVQQLQNADVVLLYDEDKAGHLLRDRLCEVLAIQVKSLKVIKLPGLEYNDSHGLDISDWLYRGHTVSELKQIVEMTNFVESGTDSKQKRDCGPLWLKWSDDRMSTCANSVGRSYVRHLMTSVIYLSIVPRAP